MRSDGQMVNEMSSKQFVDDWAYLMKEKKQYEFMDIDYVNIVCENGIVIKADNYEINYLFGNEWISLYRKGEKIAIVRLSLITFMY